VLWVTDVTQVSNWHGPLCAACVIDMFARRTVGWRVGACMPLRALLAIQMQ